MVALGGHPVVFTVDGEHGAGGFLPRARQVQVLQLVEERHAARGHVVLVEHQSLRGLPELRPACPYVAERLLLDQRQRTRLCLGQHRIGDLGLRSTRLYRGLAADVFKLVLEPRAHQRSVHDGAAHRHILCQIRGQHAAHRVAEDVDALRVDARHGRQLLERGRVAGKFGLQIDLTARRSFAVAESRLVDAHGDEARVSHGGHDARVGRIRHGRPIDRVADDPGHVHEGRQLAVFRKRRLLRLAENGPQPVAVGHAHTVVGDGAAHERLGRGFGGDCHGLHGIVPVLHRQLHRLAAFHVAHGLA